MLRRVLPADALQRLTLVKDTNAAQSSVYEALDVHYVASSIAGQVTSTTRRYANGLVNRQSHISDIHESVAIEIARRSRRCSRTNICRLVRPDGWRICPNIPH